MNAAELLCLVRSGRRDWQLHINAFVDEFRRADTVRKRELIEDGVPGAGPFEGLVAATISALCRETSFPVPRWVADSYSPEPFFAFPASGFALRLRLMLESPASFRIRNVFVPENYLTRA